jgi:hypothetical protein
MKMPDLLRGKEHKLLPLAFNSNELLVLAQVAQTCLTMLSDQLPASTERDILLASMGSVSARLSRFATQRCYPDHTLLTYNVPLAEALSLECAVRTYEEYLQKTGFLGMAPNIIALLDNVFYRVRLAIVEHYPRLGIQLVLMDKRQQRC